MSNTTLTGPKGVVANDAKTGPKGEPMTPIPSASLIILCPISNTQSEYATLMVQRKATGSFRSATVFPGGLLDQADIHAVSQTNKSSSGKNDEYLESLRLCALRETFEETGLLLVPAESGSSSNFSRAVGPSEAGMSSDEWTQLRKSVHDDARAFTQILNRFASSKSSTSLPPLAPLRHHSNWVTPRTLVRPAKRFDTHFFLTILDRADALGQLTSSMSENGIAQGSPAGLTADGSETTSLRLAKPEELLSMAIRDDIILFPPQYYLLADVHTSLKKRSQQQGQHIRFAPLQFGTEKEPEENTSSTQAPSIEGVSSVEPQGVAPSGAMIDRKRLSIKSNAKKTSSEEEEDDLFVLPLVLPGDELRPTAGQSATVPESDEAPRNRVYVTPRSRGEGGGMMVHGIHRRGITGLYDLRFGNVLPDLEGEGTSEEDTLPARNAKL
ncbi:uncharacterized protein FA14DRAFT_123516 [Meira miltonrushii]|uniref:Nudix hydrolase domain-containing protein n=1 Tax=Meira miltonrushii TaxID=1280837 RepID=A0A316V8G8_9BASI|nr:uncharacterized protein FA14DRAFT_123516 [Meira miltonrushii]PWN33504.1 hypothetical protein FA14DRAFT_123516 [Meira miltonrushii]